MADVNTSSGLKDVSSGASGGNVKWTFDTGGSVSSGITVDEDTVYFGSSDRYVYAVDASTGEEEWTFHPDDLDSRFSSSPAVIGGTLFIGSWDHHLYALDASTGEEKWAFETEDSIYSSPTVVDNTVFFGSNDNHVYAVDAATGEEQWVFDTGRYVSSSPTIVEGTLFIGSGVYGGDNIFALDATTGEERWSVQTGNVVKSSPTVFEGTVFVGSNDNHVYAFDAETGEEQWAFETGGPVWSSPTVADGTVFVGSWDDHHVYALDVATGEEKWKFETGYRIESSPTVADSTVFIGSNDHHLYALDAVTGEMYWNVETDGWLYSSPIVVDGIVFVGNKGAHVYAIDAGIEGSSEGSRVRLGTLGHHHGLAEEVVLGDDDERRHDDETRADRESQYLDASVSARVTIEDEEYLVLENLPGESSESIAFTSTEYELLKPARAIDVAISYRFCESHNIDSKYRLELAETQSDEYGSLDGWTQRADLDTDFTDLTVLMNLPPDADSTDAIDAVQTAIDWGASDTTPLNSQFARMGAVMDALDWADREVGDPGGALRAPVPELVKAAIEIAGSVTEDVELAEAAASTRDTLRATDSIRSKFSVSAVTDREDLEHPGFTALSNLNVGTANEVISSLADAQAQHLALGKGQAAARKPLLNELVELEERARNYDLGPAGVLRMHTLLQVDYQIDAIAKYGQAEIMEEYQSGRLGSALATIHDTDEMPEDLRRQANDWRNLSHYRFVATGTVFEEALADYRESVNEREFGEQTLLEGA